jgi:hypothetical protein
MTFDDVGAPGDQEFDLHPDNTGTLEYSTKLVLMCVLKVGAHLPSSDGRHGSDGSEFFV